LVCKENFPKKSEVMKEPEAAKKLSVDIREPEVVQMLEVAKMAKVVNKPEKVKTVEAVRNTELVNMPEVIQETGIIREREAKKSTSSTGIQENASNVLNQQVPTISDTCTTNEQVNIQANVSSFAKNEPCRKNPVMYETQQVSTIADICTTNEKVNIQANVSSSAKNDPCRKNSVMYETKEVGNISYITASAFEAAMLALVQTGSNNDMNESKSVNSDTFRSDEEVRNIIESKSDATTRSKEVDSNSFVMSSNVGAMELSDAKSEEKHQLLKDKEVLLALDLLTLEGLGEGPEELGSDEGNNRLTESAMFSCNKQEEKLVFMRNKELPSDHKHYSGTEKGQFTALKNDNGILEGDCYLGCPESFSRSKSLVSETNLVCEANEVGHASSDLVGRATSVDSAGRAFVDSVGRQSVNTVGRAPVHSHEWLLPSPAKEPGMEIAKEPSINSSNSLHKTGADTEGLLKNEYDICADHEDRKGRKTEAKRSSLSSDVTKKISSKKHLQPQKIAKKNDSYEAETDTEKSIFSFVSQDTAEARPGINDVANKRPAAYVSGSTTPHTSQDEYEHHNGDQFPPHNNYDQSLLRSVNRFQKRNFCEDASIRSMGDKYLIEQTLSDTFTMTSFNVPDGRSVEVNSLISRDTAFSTSYGDRNTEYIAKTIFSSILAILRVGGNLSTAEAAASAILSQGYKHKSTQRIAKESAAVTATIASVVTGVSRKSAKEVVAIISTIMSSHYKFPNFEGDSYLESCQESHFVLSASESLDSEGPVQNSNWNMKESLDKQYRGAEDKVRKEQKNIMAEDRERAELKTMNQSQHTERNESTSLAPESAPWDGVLSYFNFDFFPNCG